MGAAHGPQKPASGGKGRGDGGRESTPTPCRGPEAAARPHPPASSQLWTTPGGLVLLLVLVVLAITGVFLRLWLVHSGSTNADEATAGLIAHQITLGHTYVIDGTELRRGRTVWVGDSVQPVRAVAVRSECHTGRTGSCRVSHCLVHRTSLIQCARRIQAAVLGWICPNPPCGTRPRSMDFTR